MRLSSGQPAVGVQVRLFDLADMSQTPQMYWTHQTDETEGTGKIQRANLDGSNIETLVTLITGLEALTSIVIAP